MLQSIIRVSAILALALGILGLQTARAYEQLQTVSMDPKSGIDIQLGFPFKEAPPSGFSPVHVKINNRQPKQLSWKISFSPSYGYQGGDVDFSEVISVEPGQIRETMIFVPHAGLQSSQSRYSVISVSVSGPGVISGKSHYSSSHGGGGAETAYVAFSKSLANSSWSKVEDQLKKGPSLVSNATALTGHRFPSGTDRASRRMLSGTAVELREMTNDARAYSGISGLWLSAAEWEALSPGGRGAILEWIDSGGKLHIAAQEPHPKLAGLPASAPTAVPVGFGAVQFVSLVNGEMLVPDLAGAIIALDADPKGAWQEDYNHSKYDRTSGVAPRWELPQWVGFPRLNTFLTICFVTLFALVIGPVNLRWLAPVSRRHRLFLTVPLISALASLILLLIIVIGDGFGGLGGRNIIAYVGGGGNRTEILQEQVSRSRVLLGSDFKIGETVSLSMIKSADRISEEARLSRSREGVTGDWFKSRAVQMHRLGTSVPSRAEVVLVKSAEAGKPTLLSSVPGTLRDLYFIDGENRYWFAKEVATGRPQILAQSDRAAFEKAMHSLDPSFSVNFESLVGSITHRPNHFYAMAEPDKELTIATLPAIEWEKQTILCFGPCTQKETK